MPETKPTEGWQGRTAGRVFHYIVDSFSLCRRLGFYFADLQAAEPGAEKRIQDCSECYRRLQARIKKGLVGS